MPLRTGVSSYYANPSFQHILTIIVFILVEVWSASISSQY